MRVRFVVTGATLVLMAVALQAVATHDGILGVTPPQAFPAPGQSAEGIRTRVVVDGSPSTTEAFLSKLRAGGYIQGVEGDGPYVTAHFDQSGAAAIIILDVEDPVPAIGQVMVVEGWARTYLAPQGTSSVPILWLEAVEVGEPLLFKKG